MAPQPFWKTPLSLNFEDLKQLASQLGVDAVMLVPGPNFVRAVGHNFMSHERPFVLAIPAKGAPAALVPNLERAAWEATGFDGVTIDWRDQDGYQDAFHELAKIMPLSSVAVEGQVMRVFVYQAMMEAWPELSIRDHEADISGLRILKTPSDIAALEAAISISEAALSEVLASVRLGDTETEIEQRLIGALFAHGAEGLSFPPIVAAGANSALPHAKARPGYKIQAGDALLIDFGARKHGFAADITRTVFTGEASAKQRAVYETVLSANQAGIDACRPGATAHDIDDATTKVLEASDYKDLIRHKTGHGLGRDVHEAPYIMRGNDQKLHTGMVFTVEPGLYQPNEFGVRIEDNVLITAEGARVLTSSPKALNVLEGI